LAFCPLWLAVLLWVPDVPTARLPAVSARRDAVLLAVRLALDGAVDAVDAVEPLGAVAVDAVVALDAGALLLLCAVVAAASVRFADGELADAGVLGAAAPFALLLLLAVVVDAADVVEVDAAALSAVRLSAA